MKKYRIFVCAMILGIAGISAKAEAAVPVKETEADTICNGIYAGEIDLAGMSAAEAENAIQDYVDSFAETEITLQGSEDEIFTVTVEELGIGWANPEILDEAVSFGKKGNIVKRYKEITDLELENQHYDVQFSFDEDRILECVAALAEQIDTPAVNASMTREGDAFVITEGMQGLAVDQEATAAAIHESLMQDWQGEAVTVALVMTETEPEGKAADLEVISDILASYTTSFSTSDESRSANVRNACSKVNGTILFPGEEFSTLAVIAPFTTSNGYYAAGSYAAGKVVDSVGGGICQVSSTLYNAVLQAELEITDRSNHAMAVGYVPVGLDATVSEDSGIDFKFKNNTEYPVYIDGYTTTDKQVTITVYGVETRAEGHRVAYENVITARTEPGPEVVYADASQPVGYIDIQPAHTGFVADVYQVVYEDEVEVGREQISHSAYRMTSRYATVGTATTDPTTLSVINAAIATQSVDYCKAVVTQLATGTYTGPVPAAPQEAPEAPAESTETSAQPQTPAEPETTQQPAEVPIQ